MAWINKHWGDDYVRMAKETIEEMVSLFLYGAIVRLSSCIPDKMLEYREKATNSDDEEPLIPDNRAYSEDVGEPYMDLAAQYGLGDDMTISNPGDNRQQTIQEEYQAYVTALCLPRDVSPLRFWEVGGASLVTLMM